MQSPNQMKCVYLESSNSEPLIKTIPIPTLQSGQLLIKVDYAPINISDIKFMQGKHNSQKTFPCVPGFEGSGSVVLTGGGISSWGLSGKRVAFYTENQFGSFAEFCIAESQFCFELEENCKNQEGACSFINPMMVLAMFEICKNNNAKAVVNNAGGSQIGQMMNRYFKNNGIKVINIVRRQEQVKEYEKQENFVLFQGDEDLENQLKMMIQKTQASIYFDAIGAEWTGKILNLMPPGSKVYCYGQLSQQFPSTINTKDLIFNRKQIKGLLLNQWIVEQSYLSMQIILRKLKQLNRSDFKTVISKEFPLIHIIEAIKYYEDNMSLGKVLIRPSKQFEQMLLQKVNDKENEQELDDNQQQISGDPILLQHEQL